MYKRQSLLRRQIDTLVRGDVLVGDAFFATYFLLCALIERGVDAVFCLLYTSRCV